MQIKETSFDTSRHHIHLEIIVNSKNGTEYSVNGILDTGAPVTEFSDHFLFFTGFIDDIDEATAIKNGLQTQKYGKILLPSVRICGNVIKDYQVFVSRFEESWGVDALIGLDFFRLFSVTIDYTKGLLITEPVSE